ELAALGCVKDGVITEAGLRLFALPLDVGLARLLTQGAHEPGLAEPTLLLAAALSAGRSIFKKRDPLSPWASDRRGDKREHGCDAEALIAAMRGTTEAELDPKAMSEARAAADRYRKLGFGDARWSGPLPRRAFAELLVRVWPGSAHVRKDRGKGRYGWAAGGTEMELDPESAVRAADAEALIVLDSRAVAAQGMSSGLVITAAMPVPIAWLASMELGEEETAAPTLSEGRIVVTVSRVYAGRVLSTREAEPSGEAARRAVRDLVLAGRVMKGLLPTLEERYDLAALAVQVALTDRHATLGGTGRPAPLPPLPEWLLARLTELGLESGDDLALLDAEDLLPPRPPDDVVELVRRHYPRTLNIGDARYQIEYRLAERSAIFHQVGGTRKEAPTAMHLPHLVGLRLFWEHKNRLQPIPGRA
ncbi:MAG: hypothetical protein IT385_26195, partial [Deltaproteobacteria bacterium]|nr:hypothetical protein [Deltaproteobacteria bacterium]